MLSSFLAVLIASQAAASAPAAPAVSPEPFADAAAPPRPQTQTGDAATRAATGGWTLVVHGGAGTLRRDRITPQQDAEYRAAIDQALAAGQAVLKDGGSALDAVQAAVEVMEDNPLFNAGRGAVFTHDRTNELDASIMDGRTREAGAVARLTTSRHPIAAARAVLRDGRHVLLTGADADGFAAERGVEQMPPSWFATPRRREQIENFLRREAGDKKVSAFDIDQKFGTVGAVALDMRGHLAAATSTGGLTGKRWGRIGDSPIIGAGTYADDRSCAVSATGAGEYFIRVGVAQEICARVRLSGASLQTAADEVMAEVRELGGTGGVIVAGPDGASAFSFNTEGMYRGRMSSAGMHEVGIYNDE
ncbi:MAG: isoaspartyl peptidase/L-asparaginase [Sphingopyxis sp.]|uniref:isoaspartyl peptidase/L-asparaginase family protein n=1 Tax=Sphingopyxis sp. TaxID=1908224 RepID=UPI002AB9AA77|nr:isoaspartyl peptidase/L-asparaginase [Sphingopyxis sp.]MDZ3832048.1 isoaspartyl peptidase/L-asparaginase [Sphingopyxis sp.]